VEDDKQRARVRLVFFLSVVVLLIGYLLQSQ